MHKVQRLLVISAGYVAASIVAGVVSLLGIVVANVEIRRFVTRLLGRDFGLVGFLDACNVFRRAGDIDLGRLRTATGVGVRYDSPLGPLRLDFGFKIRPHTMPDGRERGWEYHLSIGEAF